MNHSMLGVRPPDGAAPFHPPNHLVTGRTYWCSATDHELMTQTDDSCKVTNEHFLYRL